MSHGSHRRIVLVGAGHAHLEVLRRYAKRPVADVELLLVSPYPTHVYSALMSAELRGERPASEILFDVTGLAKSAGAKFVEASVDRVEGGAQPVVHVNGRSFDASAVSIDVGAGTRGLDVVPGAREHAFPLRPYERWRALVARTRELERMAADGHTVRCVVVGGGAAGVEIALALDVRFGEDSVTVLERGDTLLGELGENAGHEAGRLFARDGIVSRFGVEVVRVTADGVDLADGEHVPADLVVWATGPAAPALVRGSGLPCDDEGYLRVDRTLRVSDATRRSAVWGAGDCVTIDGAPPLARAGVYPVRAAPVLAHNLRAAIRGVAPIHFRPPRHALAILDTADGAGLLCWRGLSTHGAWPLRLKHAIDDRFMRRYRTDGARPRVA